MEDKKFPIFLKAEAVELLREETGSAFGYRPEAEVAENAEALREWGDLVRRGQGRRGGLREPSQETDKRHEAGPVGYCVCPECGARAPHERGIPCNSTSCPKCGAKMKREFVD